MSSAPHDRQSLEGKMLIAMPGMGDPRFERSIVYLCVHSPEGAMGLVVNKPAPNITFPQLLKQLSIDVPSSDQIRTNSSPEPVTIKSPADVNSAEVTPVSCWIRTSS